MIEIKRVSERDEIPPFVYEATDSSPSAVHIHGQLTGQCLLLTKALNSLVTYLCSFTHNIIDVCIYVRTYA